MPVNQIASIVADGELLHITTIRNERHTITYRLKDLEQRLDPARFIRLGRGSLANIDVITKVGVLPGGTHVAFLSNGQKVPGQPAAIADAAHPIPETVKMIRTLRVAIPPSGGPDKSPASTIFVTA